MATTMIRDHKRIQLSIEDKARLLEVIDLGEPDMLAVRSGSDPRNAYAVRHNGKQATYCPCKAVGRCAHKQAVDWHLENRRRALFTALFDPHCSTVAMW